MCFQALRALMALRVFWVLACAVLSQLSVVVGLRVALCVGRRMMTHRLVLAIKTAAGLSPGQVWSFGVSISVQTKPTAHVQCPYTHVLDFVALQVTSSFLLA